MEMMTTAPHPLLQYPRVPFKCFSKIGPNLGAPIANKILGLDKVQNGKGRGFIWFRDLQLDFCDL